MTSLGWHDALHVNHVRSLNIFNNHQTRIVADPEKPNVHRLCAIPATIIPVKFERSAERLR
jgi:hypothetical protein